MRVRFGWLGVALALGILVLGQARPARAEGGGQVLDLLDAPVPYTAQFYVADDRGTYRGTVWHVPGRERRDFETKAGQQAILLDRAGDSAYLIAPAAHIYVGFSLAAAARLAGGLDGLRVDRVRVGEDMVSGLRAVRYRVQAVAGEPGHGGHFEGDAWFSPDGILVKAKGVLTGPDGHAKAVETGLSDLRRGAPDGRELELPAGYLGINLRSVPPEKLEQAIAGLMPMIAGRNAHQ